MKRESKSRGSPAKALPEPYRPRPKFGVLLASNPTRQAGRASSSALSLGIHTAVIASAVWATMSLGQEPPETDVEVVEVGIAQELPPPPPPPPPPQVETPPLANDVFQGFQTITIPPIIPPDIPPPGTTVIRAADFLGEGREGGFSNGRPFDSSIDSIARTPRDPEAPPSFTPMTVKPDILNRDAIGRALEREYPPVLRDSNIGGTVTLWVLVNPEGGVAQTEVKVTSGQPLLDKAAANVAQVMRFSPAFNFDQKVSVWVAIPITFRVGSVR